MTRTSIFELGSHRPGSALHSDRLARTRNAWCLHSNVDVTRSTLHDGCSVACAASQLLRFVCDLVQQRSIDTARQVSDQRPPKHRKCVALQVIRKTRSRDTSLRISMACVYRCQRLQPVPPPTVLHTTALEYGMLVWAPVWFRCQVRLHCEGNFTYGQGHRPMKR